MTENEAKEMLQAKLTCMNLEDSSCIEKGCDLNCDDCGYNYTQGTRGEQEEAIRIAIGIFEEIQQYRALGTVEELREAMEKQRAKKPIMKPYFKDMEEEYLCCPTCGEILTDRLPMDNEDFYFHCLSCGQKFDWSEEE